jgi:sodium-dependent dicarboxylate transporter 2/3/5
MAYNVPPMLVNVLIAWLYLIFLFVLLPRWRGGGGLGLNASKSTQTAVSSLLRSKYNALGPMTFHEIGVSLLFLFVVGLWLFREPKFMSGWADLLPAVEIGDSTAAMLVVFLLFVVPRDPMSLLKGAEDEKGANKSGVDSLLDWKFVQSGLPWGVVLLMGGGFALSDGADVSGLSEWVGEQLNGLKDLPNPLILFVVMIMTAAITEVASNTACANVLIPILIALVSPFSHEIMKKL